MQAFLKKNKKTSYTLLMNNWKISQIRKVFNRAAKSVFLFFFEKACIISKKKKTLLVKYGKILQVRKVSNRAAKSVFFLKIMQAFSKNKKKDVLHAFDE